MIQERRVVAAFVALQVLVPLVLLLVRLGVQGWTPETNYPYGWQVYSSVRPEVLCDLRDRCD